MPCPASEWRDLPWLGDNAHPATASNSMPKKIATRRSAIHGNGMFAVEPIKKGERLIEYKGRRRTHEEVDAGDSGDVDSGHTFLFTLNEVFVIDANFEGNSEVVWFEGNYSEYVEDLKRRRGDDAEQPHRVRYRSLHA